MNVSDERHATRPDEQTIDPNVVILTNCVPYDSLAIKEFSRDEEKRNRNRLLDIESASTGRNKKINVRAICVARERSAQRKGSSVYGEEEKGVMDNRISY